MDPRTDKVNNWADETPAADNTDALDALREDREALYRNDVLLDQTVEIPATGASDDVEAARADIEQTRAGMTETLDAIKDKLTPQNLISDTTNSIRDRASEMTGQAFDKAGQALSGVAESTKEAVSHAAVAARDSAKAAGIKAKDAGAEAIDLVRRNPLPAALIGAGLFLLWNSARQNREETRFDRYYGDDDDSPGVDRRASTGPYAASGDDSRGLRDRAGEIVGGVKERVGGAAHAASESFGQVTHALSDRAGHLTEATRQGARRAAEGTSDLLQSNPLLVGAAVVAVGCMVGMLVPESEQENAWMGETRDRLADTVINKASETVATAKDTLVQKVGDTVDSLAAGSARP